MAMPEASIHKNYFLAAREDEVGLARQIFRMQTIPVIHAEYQAPHDELGLGVLAFDATHQPAAPLGGQSVHSKRPLFRVFVKVEV
ncbi:hypothetical protein D3C81_1829200 [compost metagenome]